MAKKRGVCGQGVFSNRSFGCLHAVHCKGQLLTMYPATLNLTLTQANDDLLDSLRYLAFPRWAMHGFMKLFGSFAARRVRKLSNRLSRDVLSIEDLTRMVEASSEEKQELIDPEFQLDACFESMLSRSKELHRSILKLIILAEEWHCGYKLHKAATQLEQVCHENHSSICRLSWAIGEHDANRSERRKGFVATTQEEVAEILDRIVAGA